MERGFARLAESKERQFIQATIPTVDGTDPKALREFNIRVQGFLENNTSLTKKQCVAVIESKLSRAALEYLRGIKDRESMEPNDVLERLTKHFKYAEDRVHIMDPVYWQSVGEKVSDYAWNVDMASRSRYPANCPARKDEGALRLSLFVSGLLDYIRDQVLMNDPKTYDEAYKIAQRWEYIAYTTAKATGSSVEEVMAARSDGPDGWSLRAAMVDQTEEWTDGKASAANTAAVMTQVNAAQGNAVKSYGLHQCKPLHDSWSPKHDFAGENEVKWYVMYSYDEVNRFQQWQKTQSDPEMHQALLICNRCKTDGHTHENCKAGKKYPGHGRTT